MPYTQQVLAVLVADRHRAIAADRSFAYPISLRRSVAAFVGALGSGLTTLGAALDEEPGTVRA